MLSYILGIIESFERTHGRRPQLVYLNAYHMHELMQECPDLFDPTTAIPLGFRIVILPESELPQPKAAWLPPRRRVVQRSEPEMGRSLISWRDRG